MKKKIIFFCMVTIMTISESKADDKTAAYNMINVCQSYTAEDDKESTKEQWLLYGMIQGAAAAHLHTIRRNNIDNEFASLSPGEYGKKMCQFALSHRTSENKKTGGKYNVNNFFFDLVDMGYYMSLPPSLDNNTTN